MKTLKLINQGLLLVIFLFSFLAYSQLNDGYVLEEIQDYNEQIISFRFVNNGEHLLVGTRDGKIMVSEWDGTEYVINPTPLVDKSAETTTYFERGLLDLLYENGVLYVYRTMEEDILYPFLSNDNASLNRVESYNINLETHTSNFSHIVIDIPSLSGNHQGGKLAMIDEVLYISTGEGANFTYRDVALSKGFITQDEFDLGNGKYASQYKSSLLGKILAIDPTTGLGVSSNPFYEEGGTTNKSKVYAIGLRNPFTMVVHNGILYIADVGSSDWEEISVADKSGLNFGWGRREGFNSKNFSSNVINPETGNTFVSEFIEPTSYDDNPDPSLRWKKLKPPRLDYGHDFESRIISYTDNELSPTLQSYAFKGNSVIVGPKVIGASMGGDLENAVVFMDVYENWINYATPSGDEAYFVKIETIGTIEVDGIVRILQNPMDGNLYLARLFGQMYRLYYEDALSIDTVEIDGMTYPKDLYYDVFDRIGRRLYGGITGVDKIQPTPSGIHGSFMTFNIICVENYKCKKFIKF